MSKKPGLIRQSSMDEVLRITTKSQSGSKLTKEEKKILDAWEEGGFLAGPAKAREYMDKRKQQSDKEISDLVNLSMSNFGKDIKKSKKKFPPRTIGLREALENCQRELSMTKSLLSYAKTKRAVHRKFGVGGRRTRRRRRKKNKRRRKKTRKKKKKKKSRKRKKKKKIYS